MLSIKEIGSIVLAIVIFGFVASFPSLDNVLFAFLFGFIIITIYILAKKLIAYYTEIEIETKIWQFKRWGLYERSHFKNPIPIGIILPFLLSIITFGWVKWLALLQTDEKATTARAAKRHDFYSYSELTEWHIALVSSAGIISSLILAIIAYLINIPELAKFSIYYAFFNLLPLGQLDGTKVFFGSKIFWTILFVIATIFLGYVFFLP